MSLDKYYGAPSRDKLKKNRPEMQVEFNRIVAWLSECPVREIEKTEPDSAEYKMRVHDRDGKPWILILRRIE